MSQDLSSVNAEKYCYFSPNKAPVDGPRNDQHDSTRTVMDVRLFVIIASQLLCTVIDYVDTVINFIKLT